MATFRRDFMIDPRRLRVLRALDQHGTISAAATALHLTPSAVSQQIAVLARESGVALLEKRGRGVRLTHRATVLLTHAAVIEKQLQAAQADLAEWDAGQVGQVRIGALPTGITALVAPTLKSLRHSHPRLELRIIESEPPELFTALDMADVDIAIAVHHHPSPPVTDARYHQRDLLEDPMDVVLPTSHPAAHQGAVTIADLADQIWITSGAPGGPCAQLTQAVFTHAGFSADIRHHCSDWVAVAALISSGAGVALIPRLAQPLSMRGLRVLPIRDVPASRHLYAATRAGRQADPTIAAVLDQLATTATDWTNRHRSKSSPQ